jgi:hypothetical protein
VRLIVSQRALKVSGLPQLDYQKPQKEDNTKGRQKEVRPGYKTTSE